MIKKVVNCCYYTILFTWKQHICICIRACYMTFCDRCPLVVDIVVGRHPAYFIQGHIVSGGGYHIWGDCIATFYMGIFWIRFSNVVKNHWSEVCPFSLKQMKAISTCTVQQATRYTYMCKNALILKLGLTYYGRVPLKYDFNVIGSCLFALMYGIVRRTPMYKCIYFGLLSLTSSMFLKFLLYFLTKVTVHF